ncbi:phospholipase A [Campylobacter pinnipediorum]|uniref:phospholipase A n=2 Tax=Campylobacter pinnipediorum TaxID=1965231 RepID=UPI00084D9BA2|nr:phospholipase A [Campylobacter pinnipediorum]OPA78803.1 hypothetical protein BFG05_08145 [Campylobacter pinnipediorum subsp. pinnipediorum]
MNKSLFILFIFSFYLFANDADKFNLANELEEAGDIKGAMNIYKSLASKNIEKDSSSEEHIKSDIINNSKAKDEALFRELFAGSSISFHELNYLLLGTYASSVPNNDRQKFETKFNISIKKPIEISLLPKWANLYMAYSQTSWWQTGKHSSPFRETNYRPEVFMRLYTNNERINSFDIGVLHESNGLGGDKSRSWNRVYASSKLNFRNLSITPRVWYHIGDLSDNKDIYRYLGYGDIKAKYTTKNISLELLLRNNFHLKDNKGAVQASLVFPLFGGILGYLQYFNGYAESLIDYNHSTNKIGIGFTLLR